MKTFTSLVLFVVGALAQSMTINTPANVVECQPTLLTWTGGTAPYYLVGNFLTWIPVVDLRCFFFFTSVPLTQSILPGGTPNGAALESLGKQNSTSVTWICNIPSGQSIGLTLVDSTGLTAQSAPFTVNPGSTTSCTNTTSLVAGPTGQTTSAAGVTPVSSATSTATGTSVKASSSATSATSATSSAPAKSSGAAYANVARVGAAGVAGAAVAALIF